MHAEKNYIVSTRHVTPDTLHWIKGQAALTEHDMQWLHRKKFDHRDWQVVTYSKGQNGFFIPVDDIEHIKTLKIPEDLMVILDSIEETGDFWLMLDPDAKVTPWLKDYIRLYE